MRQIPNFLKNPLDLPQIGHRLYALTLNLGFLSAFIFKDFFAKSSSVFDCRLKTGKFLKLQSSILAACSLIPERHTQ
jgi:hypothetical protein